MKKNKSEEKPDGSLELLNRFMLEKEIKLANCPLCGADSFSYIGNHTVPALVKERMTLDEYMPLFSVECKKCHFLMFFPMNTIKAELKETPEPEKKS